MRILQYDVPLGISINHQGADAVTGFVEEGFSHFELSLRMKGMRPGMEDTLVENALPVKEALSAHTLCPWSIHLPFGPDFDIAHEDESGRALACASICKLIDMTGQWGAKLFVLHGSYEPIPQEKRALQLAHSIRSFQELDGYAQRHGMRVALENLPRSCLGNCADEMFSIMQASGYVPICFDVNHLFQEDHAAFLGQIAPYIQTTHLSDCDGTDEKHWLPGQGVVPWKMILERLQRSGYRGPYLFEIYPGVNGKVYTAQEILHGFSSAIDSQ